MYDPAKDEEEKNRKIARTLEIKKAIKKQSEEAMKNLQSQNVVAINQMAPTIPNVTPDVALPPPPQTMMDQMRPYMNSIGQAAQNYTQGFIAPNVDPVQRGGGPMRPTSIAMAPYGQGLVNRMGEDTDSEKQDVMMKIIKAMMGGG